MPVSNRKKMKLLTLCVIGILLIIVIICVFAVDINGGDMSPATLRGDLGKLKFVAAIFRHGDRTPGHGYPKDKYKDGSAYKNGWSALTLKGKQRLLSLGRFLRERYSDLLPVTYIPSDVYTLSSDADRCIMSAQSLLAGLYPPPEIQVIEPQVRWHPIPVHTVPRHLDKVVAAKRECYLYDQTLNKLYTSDEIEAINKENSDLYAKLTLESGMNISSVAQAEGLYNTLDLQQKLNLSLPTWADEKVMAQLRELAIISLHLFTHTPYMIRIRGGPLLGEVRSRLEKLVHGQDNSKIFLVSGHDLTLINILRALGFTQEKWKPEFAATLIIELHMPHDNTEAIIKVLYSNGFGNDPLHTLEIPGCRMPCNLAKFLTLSQHNVPVDWEAECQTYPEMPKLMAVMK